MCLVSCISVCSQRLFMLQVLFLLTIHSCILGKFSTHQPLQTPSTLLWQGNHNQLYPVIYFVFLYLDLYEILSLEAIKFHLSPKYFGILSLKSKLFQRQFNTIVDLAASYLACITATFLCSPRCRWSSRSIPDEVLASLSPVDWRSGGPAGFASQEGM